MRAMPRPGRRKGAFRQATRLLRISESLRARRFGLPLAELAAAFQVSERQMRRDVAALDEAGVPVETTLDPEGRSRVALRGGPQRAISLSLRQRYALLAVRRVFDVLRDTPLYEDVVAIAEKMAASLPEEERLDAEGLADRFLFLPDGGTKRYADKQDVLDALLTGVLRRLRVRASYRRAGGATHEMLLEPYAMVLYKNGLYAIGRGLPVENPDEAADRKPFVFAVERFVEAEHVRGTHFTPPAGFCAESFFQGAFGLFTGARTERVEIDFSPEARPFVEARSWHPTQRLAPRRDGGVRLSFEVADVTPVVSWVLEWGPHARARGPRRLVDEVRRQLAATAAQYE